MRMLRSSVLWESLFRLLPAGVAVLLPVMDADGNVAEFELVAANPRFVQMSGRSEDQLLGRPMSGLHPVFAQRRLVRHYERVLQRGVAEEFEQLLPPHDSSTVAPGWYEMTVVPADGRLIVMISSIEKRKSVLIEAVRMMNVDDLTGLGNRRMLKSQFWKQRQKNSGMALIYLDLNGFKQINDTYGHETGDEVLKIVAQRIRNSLRADSVIARMGGDEFAVLLDTDDQAAATGVAERLRSAIARPISLDRHTLGVTTSLGVAYYPSESDSFEALSAVADRRMYQDKYGSRPRKVLEAAAEAD